MSDKNNLKTSFKGKNILITGGTDGIGKATAILLAKHHANVFVLGRDEKKIKKTIKEAGESTGARIRGLVADVSNEKQLELSFGYISKNTKGLDVLINNASLAARSILDKDIQDLEYILKVNIESYLRCTRFALDTMIPKNSGHIINIGSLSSSLSEKDADIYVTAKSAIAGFTKSIRKKANQHSIKVSSIEPGSVATGMVTESSREKLKKIKNQTFLTPEDIAEIILFILLQPERSEIMNVQTKPLKQFLD